MSKIQEVVGQNIRLFRRARGITQEMLAEMVNISGSYVGYLERGKRSPSLDLLAKIASILEVDTAVLLTSTENVTNRELKKLMALLSDKGPEPIKFMNDVAVAYFQSLEKHERRQVKN